MKFVASSIARLFDRPYGTFNLNWDKVLKLNREFIPFEKELDEYIAEADEFRLKLKGLRNRLNVLKGIN